MGSLMIDMNKRPFDVGLNLNLILQLLTDVMCLPEWCIGIHNNVNLNVILLDLASGD